MSLKTRPLTVTGRRGIVIEIPPRGRTDDAHRRDTAAPAPTVLSQGRGPRTRAGALGIVLGSGAVTYLYVVPLLERAAEVIAR